MKGLSHCQKLGSMFVVLAMCLVLVGCGGNKLTSENVKKLKAGETTEKEATDIFGSPTKSEEVDAAVGGGKEKVLTWKSGDSEVVLTFTKEGKLRGQTVKNIKG